MGNKKRQGPTLGARFFFAVSVLYGCRSVKRGVDCIGWAV